MDGEPYRGHHGHADRKPDLIIPVLERLHERHLNMKAAKPVTYSLAGVGNLAAYEITLNPLEIN